MIRRSTVPITLVFMFGAVACSSNAGDSTNVRGQPIDAPSRSASVAVVEESAASEPVAGLDCSADETTFSQSVLFTAGESVGADSAETALGNSLTRYVQGDDELLMEGEIGWVVRERRIVATSRAEMVPGVGYVVAEVRGCAPVLDAGQ